MDGECNEILILLSWYKNPSFFETIHRGSGNCSNGIFTHFRVQRQNLQHPKGIFFISQGQVGAIYFDLLMSL